MSGFGFTLSAIAIGIVIGLTLAYAIAATEVRKEGNHPCGPHSQH